MYRAVVPPTAIEIAAFKPMTGVASRSDALWPQFNRMRTVIGENWHLDPMDVGAWADVFRNSGLAAPIVGVG